MLRVLARDKAAVSRIEAGRAWAHKGAACCTNSINSTAAGLRLAAQRRGERFMSYAQATARLRRAITKVAAPGTASTAIVREVFGDADAVAQ
jgi:hypothetical protein